MTISVPADASAGERYGVVWAEVSAGPPAGGGITMVSRAGVRVYLAVGPGGQAAASLDVTARWRPGQRRGPCSAASHCR